MNRTSVWLLSLALLATAADGQDTRKVFFRTLCLEHAGDMTELSLPSGKPENPAVAVPLYTSSISPVIEGIFVGGQAVFYPKGAATSPTDKPVPAARVTLGKSDRQLFIFLPAAKAEAGKPAYELRAFDDDTTAFKMGTVRAINLAPVPVRFVISGSTTPEIPPTKYAQFPQSTKVDEYNMYPVAVEFRSADAKWFKGYSASWKASDRRREIVVTTVDEKFKQPSVKIYPDIPPWTEQP